MISSEQSEITPATIMHHVYAVYPSFAMLAGMQLDLFTPLADGPMSAEILARSLDVQAAKLSPLLYALVTAGLLTVEEGVFANTEEADRFLVRDRPQYMGGLSGFYSTLWHATLNTAESVRTGKPQAKLDWMSLPEEQLVRFFQKQYPGSLRAGREFAGKMNFAGFKHILDAGGGTGGLSIGICEAYPDLRSTVADLPSVVTVSKRFIAEAGLSHRIKTIAVDLTESQPVGKYDVAVLRALLQVMSAAEAGEVLMNVSKAIQPGGSLFIIGSILDDSRLSPPASVAYGLAFLNVYDKGCSYTEEEHHNWLLKAGFSDISIRHGATFDGLSLVAARKA
ncbi:MAG: methyltransferase [Syntrophobacteraceae bacterium]